MNIDTDTQYAFSRSIADTVLKNYDGFLKVDGEVGNKKVYDPRAWGKIAEIGHGRSRRRGDQAARLRRPLAEWPQLRARRPRPVGATPSVRGLRAGEYRAAATRSRHADERRSRA